MLNISLLLVALATFSATAVSQEKAIANTTSNDMQSLSDGFYYRSLQGWDKLQPISMAGGGVKHAGKMFVPGLTPQMVWTFRGAEAPIQIFARKPEFLIKEPPQLANIAGRSERDVVIVRFDKKKDHRELQVTNGGNMVTFKAGLSKDRTPDITVKEVSNGIFAVTPTKELMRGEYLITFDRMSASGYDFGVK
jgi:hypothetical protein